MGIHGSSTCVMNFDDSIGFLIGCAAFVVVVVCAVERLNARHSEPNNGLKQMFTFMNTARIGTAIQGIGACELAYQVRAPHDWLLC